MPDGLTAMVLADTSVWVRALSRRAPYLEKLDGLLAREHVTGHCMIRGELLMGDTGTRSELLARYELLPWIRPVEDHEVAAFVRARRLCGRGIGWIDAHLLASTLASGARLWTADAALQLLARELGVAAEV